MGVNEAGRPLIHSNQGYDHDVAEAHKHAPPKNSPKAKAGSAGAPNGSSQAPKQPVSKAAHVGAQAKREQQLKPAERREINVALDQRMAAVTGAQIDAATRELEGAVGHVLTNLAGRINFHSGVPDRKSFERAASIIANAYARDGRTAQGYIGNALVYNGIDLAALRR